MKIVKEYLDGAETPMGALDDGGKSIYDSILSEEVISAKTGSPAITVLDLVGEGDDGRICERLRHLELDDTYDYSGLESLVNHVLPKLRKLDKHYHADASRESNLPLE